MDCGGTSLTRQPCEYMYGIHFKAVDHTNVGCTFISRYAFIALSDSIQCHFNSVCPWDIFA